MTVLRLSTLYHPHSSQPCYSYLLGKLALDIDLLRILLLLIVAHAVAIVLHTIVIVYHLQYPCPCLA